MSFLLGKTQSIERVPKDIQGLRGNIAGGFQAGDLFSPELSDVFLERILGPARALFTQSREQAFAQAKESAGNLTGSGFANILGESAQRSLTDENAFVSQLLNAERQRQQQRLQLAISFATAGVAPPEVAYQPGFLDYLFQGASGVASAYGATRKPPTTGGGGTSSGNSTGVRVPDFQPYG